jgi:hypothetical protein
LVIEKLVYVQWMQHIQRKSGAPIGIPALPREPHSVGQFIAVPQGQIQPISSGPEFSDYEEPNRERSQHINPGDEKPVRR